jgi:hypothetical protein
MKRRWLATKADEPGALGEAERRKIATERVCVHKNCAGELSHAV